MMDYRFVKRSLDALGAAGLLVVASPALGITALLVRRNLGRPVIFTQERPGKEGKIFRLYKFRSMKDVDLQSGLVSDEDRLTDFGRWLRSTSMDELPSLVNVIKGDMSFVGPRPLLVQYLDRYSSRQARRHEVRPGITGLAQVSGRNTVDWETRFEIDVEYVENISFLLDIQILVQTVFSVLRRTGISAEGEATMTEFTGAPGQSD